MVSSNLTSDSPTKKSISFYGVKRLSATLFNRSNVIKFLNEYFCGFSEEELHVYRKSKERQNDLDQL
jgi:hypothetical protein